MKITSEKQQSIRNKCTSIIVLHTFYIVSNAFTQGINQGLAPGSLCINPYNIPWLYLEIHKRRRGMISRGVI